MAASDTSRIVLLGKTGCGKSSLGNTILGEILFKPYTLATSGTKTCQDKTKEINGRSVTVIDTPGFFDTDSPEEELKSEVVKCITECADGIHAFLIVFKVEKFTAQEQAVISKICEYFSEDALKYASIVFTRGDDLEEGQKIEDFVAPNQSLCDLVKKCGDCCHVFDNKHWKNEDESNYRSNKFQLAKLLENIDEIIRRNDGRCYTNEMLQEVSKKKKLKEGSLRRLFPNMSEEEIKKHARDSVTSTLQDELKGFCFKDLLGGFFGQHHKALLASLKRIASGVEGAVQVGRNVLSRLFRQ